MPPSKRQADPHPHDLPPVAGHLAHATRRFVPEGALDAALAWPSGRGDEVGVVEATLPEAWLAITRNAGALGRDLRVSEVVEDGLTALLLQGLPGSPVTLVSEPDLSTTRLAVVADRGADPEPLRLALLRLLPGHGARFYHAE